MNGAGAGNIGSNRVHVYINGSLSGNNVSDYYQKVTYGATVKVVIASVATGNWYQGTQRDGSWIDGTLSQSAGQPSSVVNRTVAEFTMPASNTSINMYFPNNYFTITVNKGANVVEVGGGGQYLYGQVAYIMGKAAPGYWLYRDGVKVGSYNNDTKRWEANDATPPITGNWTFNYTAVSSATTVTWSATFEGYESQPATMVAYRFEMYNYDIDGTEHKYWTSNARTGSFVTYTSHGSNSHIIIIGTDDSYWYHPNQGYSTFAQTNSGLTLTRRSSGTTTGNMHDGYNFASSNYNTGSLNFTVTLKQKTWQRYGATAPAIEVSNNTYIIDSTDDWARFVYMASANADTEGLAFDGKTINLIADLNLSAKYSHPIGFSTNGTYHSSFAGIFNGNGHTISGVKMQLNNASSVGLFSITSSSNKDDFTGIIKNILLDNISIKATNSTYVGGLVGQLYGMNITDSGVRTGTIDATGARAGGLVGVNNGVITKCYTASGVSVKTTGPSAGGIVGYASNTISYSYSMASRSASTNHAGIAGAVSSSGIKIQYCYSTHTSNSYDISGNSVGTLTGCYGTYGNGSIGGTTTIEKSKFLEWSTVDTLLQHGFGYVSVNDEGKSTTTDTGWNATTHQYNNEGLPIIVGFMGQSTCTITYNIYVNDALVKGQAVNGYQWNIVTANVPYTVNTSTTPTHPWNISRTNNWQNYQGNIYEVKWKASNGSSGVHASNVSSYKLADTCSQQISYDFAIMLKQYNVTVQRVSNYTSLTINGGSSKTVTFGYNGSYNFSLELDNTKNVIGNIQQGGKTIYDRNTQPAIGGFSNVQATLTQNGVNNTFALKGVIAASTFTVKPYYTVTIDNDGVENTVEGTKGFNITYNGNQSISLGKGTKTIYVDLGQSIRFQKDACDIQKTWLFLRGIRLNYQGKETYIYGSATNAITGTASDYAAINKVDTTYSSSANNWNAQYNSDSGVTYTMVYAKSLYTLTIQLDINNAYDRNGEGNSYTIKVEQDTEGITKSQELSTTSGQPLQFTAKVKTNTTYTITLHSSKAYAIYAGGKVVYGNNVTLQSSAFTIESDYTVHFTVLRLVSAELVSSITNGFGTTNNETPYIYVSNVQGGYNTTTYQINNKTYYSLGQTLTVTAYRGTNDFYDVNSWKHGMNQVNMNTGSSSVSNYTFTLTAANTGQQTDGSGTIAQNLDTVKITVTFVTPTMSLYVGRNRTDVNVPRVYVKGLADLLVGGNVNLDPYNHKLESISIGAWHIEFVSYLQEQQGTDVQATRQIVKLITYNGKTIVSLSLNSASGSNGAYTFGGYTYYKYTVTVGERYAIFRSDDPVNGQEEITVNHETRVNRYKIDSHIVTIGRDNATSYTEDFAVSTVQISSLPGTEYWYFQRVETPSTGWISNAVSGAEVFAAITYLPYYNVTNTVIPDETNCSELFKDQGKIYGGSPDITYEYAESNSSSGSLVDIVKNLTFKPLTNNIALLGNYIKISYTVPDGVLLDSWSGFGHIVNGNVVPYTFTLPTSSTIDREYTQVLADGKTTFKYAGQKVNNTYILYYRVIDLADVKDSVIGSESFAWAQNYQFSIAIREKPYNLVINYRINGNIKVVNFGTIKIYEYYLDGGKPVYNISNVDYTINSSTSNGEITIPTYVFGQFYIVLETNDPRYTYGSVSIGSNLASSSVTTGTDNWKGTIATRDKNTTSSQTISFNIKESWTLTNNQVKFTTKYVTKNLTSMGVHKLTVKNGNTSVFSVSAGNPSSSWTIQDNYNVNSVNVTQNNIWILNNTNLTFSLSNTTSAFTYQILVNGKTVSNNASTTITSDMTIEVIATEKSYTFSKEMQYYNNGSLASGHENTSYVVSMTSNAVSQETSRVGYSGYITTSITMPKAQSYGATSNPTGSAYYYIVNTVQVNGSTVTFNATVSDDATNATVNINTINGSIAESASDKSIRLVINFNAIWKVSNNATASTQYVTEESQIHADNRLGGSVNVEVTKGTPVNQNGMYPSGSEVVYTANTNLGYKFTSITTTSGQVKSNTVEYVLSGSLPTVHATFTEQSYTLTVYDYASNATVKGGTLRVTSTTSHNGVQVSGTKSTLVMGYFSKATLTAIETNTQNFYYNGMTLVRGTTTKSSNQNPLTIGSSSAVNDDTIEGGNFKADTTITASWLTTGRISAKTIKVYCASCTEYHTITNDHLSLTSVNTTQQVPGREDIYIYGNTARFVVDNTTGNYVYLGWAKLGDEGNLLKQTAGEYPTVSSTELQVISGSSTVGDYVYVVQEYYNVSINDEATEGLPSGVNASSYVSVSSARVLCGTSITVKANPYTDSLGRKYYPYKIARKISNNCSCSCPVQPDNDPDPLDISGQNGYTGNFEITGDTEFVVYYKLAYVLTANYGVVNEIDNKVYTDFATITMNPASGSVNPNSTITYTANLKNGSSYQFMGWAKYYGTSLPVGSALTLVGKYLTSGNGVTVNNNILSITATESNLYNGSNRIYYIALYRKIVNITMETTNYNTSTKALSSVDGLATYTVSVVRNNASYDWSSKVTTGTNSNGKYVVISLLEGDKVTISSSIVSSTKARFTRRVLSIASQVVQNIDNIYNNGPTPTTSIVDVVDGTSYTLNSNASFRTYQVALYTAEFTREVVINYVTESITKTGATISSASVGGATAWSIDGKTYYDAGTAVTVTVTVENGFTLDSVVFQDASGNTMTSQNTNNQYTVGLNKQIQKCIVTVTENEYIVTTGDNAAGNLTCESENSKYSFTNGQIILGAFSTATFKATPKANYRFVTWTVEGSCTHSEPLTNPTITISNCTSLIILNTTYQSTNNVAIGSSVYKTDVNSGNTLPNDVKFTTPSTTQKSLVVDTNTAVTITVPTVSNSLRLAGYKIQVVVDSNTYTEKVLLTTEVSSTGATSSQTFTKHNTTFTMTGNTIMFVTYGQYGYTIQAIYQEYVSVNFKVNNSQYLTGVSATYNGGSITSGSYVPYRSTIRYDIVEATKGIYKGYDNVTASEFASTSYGTVNTNYIQGTTYSVEQTVEADTYTIFVGNPLYAYTFHITSPCTVSVSASKPGYKGMYEAGVVLTVTVKQGSYSILDKTTGPNNFTKDHSGSIGAGTDSFTITVGPSTEGTYTTTMKQLVAWDITLNSADRLGSYITILQSGTNTGLYTMVSNNTTWSKETLSSNKKINGYTYSTYIENGGNVAIELPRYIGAGEGNIFETLTRNDTPETVTVNTSTITHQGTYTTNSSLLATYKGGERELVVVGVDGQVKIGDMTVTAGQSTNIDIAEITGVQIVEKAGYSQLAYIEATQNGVVLSRIERDGTITQGDTFSGSITSGFTFGNTPPDVVITVYFDAISWSDDGIRSSSLSTSGTDYVIRSAADLGYLAYVYRQGNGESFAGKTFLLSNDISLSGHYMLPIGTKDNPFNGIFDGQGHTIQDITVVGNTLLDTIDGGVGFFGSTDGATIKEMTLQNYELRYNNSKTSANNPTLTVGLIAGVVENSNVYKVEVDSFTYKVDIYHANTIGNMYFGTVAGKVYNSYILANYVHNGTIEFSYENSLSALHNKGVIGGLVGQVMNGNIADNMIGSDVTMDIQAGQWKLVGGMLGENVVAVPTIANTTNILKNNLVSMQITNQATVSAFYGLVGNNTTDLTIEGMNIFNGQVNGTYTTKNEIANGTTSVDATNFYYVGGSSSAGITASALQTKVEEENTIFVVGASGEITLPYWNSRVYTNTISLTPSNGVITITTAQQLQSISKITNWTGITKIEVVKDIDLEGYIFNSFSIPNGVTFNGRWYKISNFILQDTGFVTTNAGEMTQVYLSNVKYLTGSNLSTYNGLLVSVNTGVMFKTKVENGYLRAIHTVANTEAYIGLVGQNTGRIEQIASISIADYDGIENTIGYMTTGVGNNLEPGTISEFYLDATTSHYVTAKGDVQFVYVANNTWNAISDIEANNIVEEEGLELLTSGFGVDNVVYKDTTEPIQDINIWNGLDLDNIGVTNYHEVFVEGSAHSLIPDVVKKRISSGYQEVYYTNAEHETSKTIEFSMEDNYKLGKIYVNDVVIYEYKKSTAAGYTVDVDGQNYVLTIHNVTDGLYVRLEEIKESFSITVEYETFAGDTSTAVGSGTMSSYDTGQYEYDTTFTITTNPSTNAIMTSIMFNNEVLIEYTEANEYEFNIALGNAFGYTFENGKLTFKVNANTAGTYKVIFEKVYTFSLSAAGPDGNTATLSNNAVTWNGQTLGGYSYAPAPDKDFAWIEGTSILFTFTAEDGYEIESVLDGTGKEYSPVSISQDKKEVTWVVEVSSNATLSYKVIYAYTMVEVEIEPDRGVTITNIVVDNESRGSDTLNFSVHYGQIVKVEYSIDTRYAWTMSEVIAVSENSPITLTTPATATMVTTNMIEEDIRVVITAKELYWTDAEITDGVNLLGSGTELDPYEIITVAQFGKFLSMLQEGNTFEGKYVRVIGPLDFESRFFVPMQNFAGYMVGRTDSDYTVHGAGRYAELSNIYIDITQEETRYSSIGWLDNLTGSVVGFHIQGLHIDVRLEDGTPVGLLAGTTSGYIHSVEVTDGSIVTTTTGYVGGLYGRVLGGTTTQTIVHITTIEAQSETAVIAGFAGSLNGGINNTLVEISEVIGQGYGFVATCDNNGSLVDSIVYIENGNISYTMQVNNGGQYGLYVINGTSTGVITGVSYTNATDLSNFVTLNTEIWKVNTGVSDLPYIEAEDSTQVIATPGGGIGGIYTISTAEQLFWLAEVGIRNNDYNNSNVTFRLTRNIDLSGYRFTGIGTEAYPFRAKFDGNYKVISNVYIDRADGYVDVVEDDYWTSPNYVGIFGYTNGATISNLYIDNLYVAGYSQVGMIGYAINTVLNGAELTNVTINGGQNTGVLIGGGDNNTIENVYVNIRYAEYLFGNVTNTTLSKSYYEVDANIEDLVGTGTSTVDVDNIYILAYSGQKGLLDTANTVTTSYVQLTTMAGAESYTIYNLEGFSSTTDVTLSTMRNVTTYTSRGFDMTNIWDMDSSNTINNGMAFLRYFHTKHIEITENDAEKGSYTPEGVNGLIYVEYRDRFVLDITAIEHYHVQELTIVKIGENGDADEEWVVENPYTGGSNPEMQYTIDSVENNYKINIVYAVDYYDFTVKAVNKDNTVLTDILVNEQAGMIVLEDQEYSADHQLIFTLEYDPEVYRYVTARKDGETYDALTVDEIAGIITFSIYPNEETAGEYAIEFVKHYKVTVSIEEPTVPGGVVSDYEIVGTNGLGNGDEYWVDEGSQVTVTFLPADHRYFVSGTDNDVEFTTSSYTISNLQEAHTIVGTMANETYTVTINSNHTFGAQDVGYGIVEYAVANASRVQATNGETFSIVYGESLDIWIEPNTKIKVARVRVNDVEVEMTSNHYYTALVLEDSEIEIEFEKDYWTNYAEVVVENNGVYTITKAEQLAYIASQVNDNHNTFEGKIIRIASDLDLSGHYWEPIGNAQSIFQGSIEGNGYSISNMMLLDEQYAGLIGNAQDSTVSQVILKDVQVATIDQAVQYAGSLIAYGKNSSITGVETRGGNITVASIDASSYVGGLVGYLVQNGQEIRKVVNQTAIHIISGQGIASGLVGGIEGYGKIVASINYGQVHSADGRSYGLTNGSDRMSIEESMQFGEVVSDRGQSIGLIDTGAIKDVLLGGTITGSTTRTVGGSVTTTNLVILGETTDYTGLEMNKTWAIYEGINLSTYQGERLLNASELESGQYPIVISAVTEGNWIDVAEAVTAMNNTYTVIRPEQWAYIVRESNSNAEFTTNKTVVLGNPIDFFGKELPSIATWKGTLDGQGYALRYIYGSEGLMTEVEAGTVENVIIENIYVAKEEMGNAGILAGTVTDGTIRKVTILEGYIAGENEENIGGLVGEAISTTITNVQATIFIERTDANANLVVGGLVGSMQDSSITLSYVEGEMVVNTANIVGSMVGNISGATTIENSYSMIEPVAVTNANTIGVIGNISAGATGSIQNIYAVTNRAMYNKTGTSSISIKNTYGVYQTQNGVTKVTSEELKDYTTYDKTWDFVNTWAYVEGENEGYPVLYANYQTTTITIQAKNGANVSNARENSLVYVDHYNYPVDSAINTVTLIEGSTRTIRVEPKETKYKIIDVKFEGQEVVLPVEIDRSGVLEYTVALNTVKLTIKGNLEAKDGAVVGEKDKIVLYLKSTTTKEVITIVLTDEQVIEIPAMQCDTYTIRVGSQMYYTSSIKVTMGSEVEGRYVDQIELDEDGVIEITKTKDMEKWLNAGTSTY